MGTLYVLATPIGNLEDITLRALRLLLTVPVIACEDTRHTGQLVKLLTDRWAGKLEINPNTNRKYVSVRDWNEADAVNQVLALLQSSDVALVSDAGTPLISDPGFKLVRSARQAGFPISPLPGANAAIAALSASGLPTDKFAFIGFVGKKLELVPNMTNVIYESPYRLQKTLAKIQAQYPQSEIMLAAELTKIHERIAPLAEWSQQLNKPQGEWVILVSFDRS
ncbi:MAG: 16S rRNA (cytidine(1402)-2'-O)-methyltransferase [bacterium]|nr:16S rRNA (cytidine(1402)-2'-O)-methyltransferase [bacterium]